MEYPKLLRPIGDVVARVEAEGLAGKVRGALHGLETAYLSRTLANLFEAVNMAFGEEKAPAEDDLDRITQLFLNLLQVTSFDAPLCASVGRNIVKTIKLFGVKSEALITTNDGEATQVIGPPNATQKRNMEAMQALYRLSTNIPNQLEKVGSGGVTEEVRTAAGELQSLVKASLAPLLQSFSESIDAIVETMHQEDFSMEEGGESGVSLYMRELEEFVGRVWASHLRAVGCGDVVREAVGGVARRAVRTFLVQASLVRPLGQGGRLRLAADCAQLQYALSPLCAHLAADLGPDLAALQAARPLLFSSPEEIAGAVSLGKELPFWLAAHLLFQSAGSDLALPHETAGWSRSRYADWLEAAAPAERLQFLRGSLDAYARQVAAEGRSEYAPAYPLLLKVLQKAAEQAV